MFFFFFFNIQEEYEPFLLPDEELECRFTSRGLLYLFCEFCSPYKKVINGKRQLKKMELSKVLLNESYSTNEEIFNAYLQKWFDYLEKIQDEDYTRYQEYPEDRDNIAKLIYEKIKSREEECRNILKRIIEDLQAREEEPCEALKKIAERLPPAEDFPIYERCYEGFLVYLKNRLAKATAGTKQVKVIAPKSAIKLETPKNISYARRKTYEILEKELIDIIYEYYINKGRIIDHQYSEDDLIEDIRYADFSRSETAFSYPTSLGALIRFIKEYECVYEQLQWFEQATNSIGKKKQFCYDSYNRNKNKSPNGWVNQLKRKLDTYIKHRTANTDAKDCI